MFSTSLFNLLRAFVVYLKHAYSNEFVTVVNVFDTLYQNGPKSIHRVDFDVFNRRNRRIWNSNLSFENN